MDLKFQLDPSEYITSIKFDCMQTSRRLELSNGKEAKVEEKCERYQGDIKGFRPVEITQNNQKLQLDPNNAQVS
ncbi:hypothetical protein GCK32_022454 [Trichostrongylus colubriformis]|uniref:Uncharacterized protein n=1 Tax=Trichostrongylus colubriformis TaxID=6319 RepID=A0AAN8G994_TRICO